jgi:hypothetical protein
MACAMPANWRGDCPHEREVRNRSQRDSEAATVQTTQHCATLYSVVKGTAQREVSPRTE